MLRHSGGGPLSSRASVIVAVLDRPEELSRCIDSVAAQRHSERELIIIDGGSGQKTLDVLHSRQRDIDYWESQPDSGIYNAWNKGLSRVTGDWVLFLGADDQLAHPHVLSRLVATAVAHDADVVCAQAALVDKGGSTLRLIGGPWDWKTMKKHQSVAHPGMLHRRNLFARYGKFDESYSISGDYDFLLRLGPRPRAVFLREVAVCMGVEGMSRTQVSTLLKESWRIQAHHPAIGRYRASVNFLVNLSKFWGRSLLHRP